MKIISSFFLLNILLFFFLSCNKKSSEIEPRGDSYLSFNALYMNNEDIPIKSASTKSINSNKSEKDMIFEVPFDDIGILEFHLEEQISEIEPSQSNSLTKKASTGNLKAAIKNIVPNGVKYRLVAYDELGGFVNQTVYTTGSENLTPDFKLDAGKTYTFIFISYNNEITPPEMGSDNLSSAMLSSINSNQDLMYYTVSKNLVYGNNKIDIIFKHKFSKISTTIDASEVGNIQNSTSTPVSIRFSPNSSTVNLQASSGILTYNTSTMLDVNFPFSSPTPIVQNSVVYLANNSVSTTTFTIRSITINGTTRTNLPSISLGNLLPGMKYALNIKIKNDGVVDDIIFAPGNLVYTQATNTYSFAEFQYSSGSLFPINKLTPVYPNSPISTTLADGDPCSKIPSVNGKAWRVPTNNDINTGLANHPSSYDIKYTMNNIPGRLILGKVFLPIVQYYKYNDQDYVYLSGPSTGLTVPYLAHYAGYTSDYSSFFFRVSENTAMYSMALTTSSITGIFGPQENYPDRNGYPIRCVRDK